MVILKSSELKKTAQYLGADTVGITPVIPVGKKKEYLDWLNRGYAAEMEYLKKNQSERFNPENLLEGAKSIIVIGINYFHTEDKTDKDMPYKVAKYAWGEDYHRVLRRLLKKYRSHLKSINPDIKGRICVDTAPFMDKYWAQMAGLGWQGKHTNLVSREYGSWLVLGSLIINAEVDKYDAPLRDYCGTCTDCIDACPTKAIIEPNVLDSNRCISYWTIESKSEKIPVDIANMMDDYIFGCDICLSICPFNRFQKKSTTDEFKKLEDLSIIESGNAEDLVEDEFQKKFSHSMVNRRGKKGIEKNIAAVSNSHKSE